MGDAEETWAFMRVTKTDIIIVSQMLMFGNIVENTNLLFSLSLQFLFIRAHLHASISRHVNNSRKTPLKNTEIKQKQILRETLKLKVDRDQQ